MKFSLLSARRGYRFAATVLISGVTSAAVALSGTVSADPIVDRMGDYGDPVPLPVFVPAATDWEPLSPFPFDELRHLVTPTDITAVGEMCQWFGAQYIDIRRQIDRLNNTIVRHNGDFAAPEVVPQLETVLGNINQALSFLGPRAQALTQSYDRAGDMFFPIYQGDSFYGLWQQLSNVGAGLAARQPTWFTGPSVMRAKHWGSKIDRSHACR